MSLLNHVASAALDPSPDQARAWLQRELLRSEYQEPWGQRVQRWLGELFDALGAAASGSGPVGMGLAVVLVLVAVAVLGLALSRLRASGPGPDVSAEVFASSRRTAREHREAAERALDEDRHDDAVWEAVRALTAGLVERGLVADSVGLTVLEVARAGAARFPEQAEDLDRLRTTFEDTRYGERHADRAAAVDVLQVERAVAEAAVSAASHQASGAAVPS